MTTHVPLRVVVLNHTASLGGAELALLRTLRPLAALGHEVHVLLLEDGQLRKRLVQAGIPTHVVELPARTLALKRHDLLRRPLAAARALVDVGVGVARLTRRVKDLDPDVLQTNSMKAHLLGLAVSPLTGTPLVWWLHDRLASDYLPAPLVTLLRLLSRLPSAVVVNSQATAMTVPRATVTAYPGIGPDQVLSAADVARRSPPSSPLFLLLGRVSPTKGQVEFVEAARMVADAVPDARFLVVGHPMFGAESYLDRVKRRVNELGLGHLVDFHGFAENPSCLMDSASAVVHASPVPEPFGQVVVEACVRGVPVIATEAGGVPEILSPRGDSKLGLLVPPGDVPSLARAMVSVASDPGGAHERALAAYRYATSTFTAPRTAAQFEAVWRQVTARGRPRRGQRASVPPGRTSPEPQGL